MWLDVATEKKVFILYNFNSGLKHLNLMENQRLYYSIQENVRDMQFMKVL